MELRNINNPIFIGGASRSGTTLLLRLIRQSCYSAYTFPIDIRIESFLYGIKVNHWNSIPNIIFTFLTLSRVIDVKREKTITFLDEFTYRQAALNDITNSCEVENISQDSFYEILKYIGNKFCQYKQKQRWCGKDTYIELQYEKLIEHFPNAQFIFMLRDPRASLCSELYMGTYPERSTEEIHSLELNLKQWIESAEKIKDLASKDNVMIVKFRDLVNNPEEMRQLTSKFLQNKMTSWNTEVKPFSSYGVKEKKIYNTDNKWRDLLTRSEVKYIEEKTKHLWDY